MLGALNQAINNTNAQKGLAVNALYSGISGANDTLFGTLQNEQSPLQPYLNMGAQGLQSLTSMLSPGGALTGEFSFNPTDIANNPDYRFALQQGDQAVQRSAAANGTLMSGGTEKALDQYSQGLASQYMQQYYNMAANTFNMNRTARLQDATLPISIGQGVLPLNQTALQAYGSQAANNIMGGNEAIASTTMNASQQLNNLLEGKGNASAAGSIMQGNLWGNFLKSGSLASAISPIWNAIPGDNTATQAIGAVMGV